MKANHAQGKRNVDDWYIGFNHAGNADDAIPALASACAEYALELNAEKTASISAGGSFEAVWPSDLKKNKISTDPLKQKVSIEHFFAISFDYADKYKNQNVLDFAVKISRSIKISKKNWDLYETFILNAARASELVLPACAGVLINYFKLHYPLSMNRIKKLIDDTIQEHAPLGHHGEVSWALFLAKELSIKLDKLSAKAISRLESSICALLALDMHNKGLIPIGLNLSRWLQEMNVDSLCTEMWLLSYEAEIKGWLPVGTPSHVDNHPQFKLLKSRKISFYDEKASVMPLKGDKQLKVIAGLAKLSASL